MAIVRRFLSLSVLTLLFSSLVASPTFAASSVSNWHKDVEANSTIEVGKSFCVENANSRSNMIGDKPAST